MIVLSQDVYDQLTFIYGEDELRPDYSGRGMYGATCLAYSGDTPTRFAVDLADLIVSLERDGDYSVQDLIATVQRIGEPSTDSMGRDSVYYWRGIQVEGHERESQF